jgi:hypothetical protein
MSIVKIAAATISRDREDRFVAAIKKAGLRRII